ncbi:MAG: hypothetical protein GOV15_03760 [Candidatus Diapherotrites archaeon]|nr:hypothetical protein [Candidatus Diapherotrites archaeon]
MAVKREKDRGHGSPLNVRGMGAREAFEALNPQSRNLFGNPKTNILKAGSHPLLLKSSGVKGFEKPLSSRMLMEIKLRGGLKHPLGRDLYDMAQRNPGLANMRVANDAWGPGRPQVFGQSLLQQHHMQLAKALGELDSGAPWHFLQFARLAGPRLDDLLTSRNVDTMKSLLRDEEGVHHYTEFLKHLLRNENN